MPLYNKEEPNEVGKIVRAAVLWVVVRWCMIRLLFININFKVQCFGECMAPRMRINPEV